MTNLFVNHMQLLWNFLQKKKEDREQASSPVAACTVSGKAQHPALLRRVTVSERIRGVVQPLQIRVERCYRSVSQQKPPKDFKSWKETHSFRKATLNWVFPTRKKPKGRALERQEDKVIRSVTCISFHVFLRLLQGPLPINMYGLCSKFKMKKNKKQNLEIQTNQYFFETKLVL